MDIVIPKYEDIQVCAQVYTAAYHTEPWNEVYDEHEVEKYIVSYLNSDTKRCFAFTVNKQIRGVALGLVIPCISSPYLRIEDFCIDPEVHRKGYGSTFMELLIKEALKLGCDSILLGTQKDFPSHHIYLKNRFKEIESVLLYKDIK